MRWNSTENIMVYRMQQLFFCKNKSFDKFEELFSEVYTFKKKFLDKYENIVIYICENSSKML